MLHYQETRRRQPGSQPLGNSHPRARPAPSAPSPSAAALPTGHQTPAEAEVQAAVAGVRSGSGSGRQHRLSRYTGTESGAALQWVYECARPLHWEATAVTNISENEYVPPTTFIGLCNPPCPHPQLRNSLLISSANGYKSFPRVAEKTTHCSSKGLNRLIKQPGRFAKSAS